MSHYKLKATVDGSEVIGESLELTGSKSFKVFPVSKNDTNTPIRGSAVVNILGKNYSIQLNHKINSQPDPEPSTTKWSYVENMYITGNTPVASQDIKSQDTAYVRASRGTTMYISNSSIITKLFVSKSYTNYSNLLDTVGDFSGTTYSTQYSKGDIMTLFTFVMFYKYSTESDGVVIPPTDDGTPASNKARIPCRPDASGAPDWIKNAKIIYRVVFTTSSGSSTREFDNWDGFIAFWDSIQTNPSYTNAVFSYIYQGTIDFNELLNQRGSNTITVAETDNGKGVGRHGAKSVYLTISQQEGKTSYSLSSIPVTSDMWRRDNSIKFANPTSYEMYTNRLSGDDGTYLIRPQFRIDTRDTYKATPIPSLTSSVITNTEGAGTFNYQYLGKPIILKLFKETANGIEGVSMRPYYKITGSTTTTEFWKDSSNLMGSQNFNPLKYNNEQDDTHNISIRTNIGRGFYNSTHGMCVFQLIPICLYKGDGTTVYNPVNHSLNENYNDRYTDYLSAIKSGDRSIAAFLKWPNADGNNDPSHIDSTVDDESLPSYVGKKWESSIQKDSSFKVIDRVMFLPVLWCEKSLEDNSNLRSYLNSPRFGNYIFSPNITDADIDLNPGTVYRITINGLDIQVR